MPADRSRSARRSWRLAPLALLVLLALPLACGDDDSASGAAPAGSGSSPTAAQLNGNTYRSTSVQGQALVADTSLTLHFEANRISANAGCNQMNGGYTIDEGVLRVGNMAQTLMACPDDLQKQDDWVAALLTSNPAISLAGDTLTLSGNGVTITAKQS